MVSLPPGNVNPGQRHPQMENERGCGLLRTHMLGETIPPALAPNLLVKGLLLPILL